MAARPDLPQRKGYGTTGRPVDLITNFFPLSFKTRDFSQYRVDIEPEVLGRKLRSKVFSAFKKARLDEDPKAFGTVTLFDGFTLFAHEHFQDLTGSVTVDGTDYTVQVRYTNALSTSEFPKSATQLFNIVVRRCYREMGLQPIRRNYFDPAGAVPVTKHELQIWPGYSSSVLCVEGGVMLNVDQVFKIIRNTTVLDMLSRYLKLPPADRSAAATKDLRGMVVTTKYNNATYMITEIDFNLSPKSSFDHKKSGSSMTVADYFKQRYGLTNLALDQPLIVIKKKRRESDSTPEAKPTWLVPQLCFVTGLTEDMRADFNLMRDVAETTRVGPQGRIQVLKHYIERITKPEFTRANKAPTPNPLFEWQIKLQEQPQSVKARQLPPERIVLQEGGKGAADASDKADWTGLLRSNPIRSAPVVEEWIVIQPQRDSNVCSDFLQMINRVSGPLGISLPRPTVLTIERDSIDDYRRALEGDALRPSCGLVLIMLSNNRKDRYDALKHYTTQTKPIPTQCVVVKTILNEKRRMTVATKVVLQMACKMGGELWTVDNLPPETMVVGIDVNHDSQTRGESVMALCASLNASFTKYCSVPVYQAAGQEIGDCVGQAMKVALEAFRGVNHTLPTRVVIYRDGVGEGQLAAVTNMEVPQVKTAFAQFPNYDPQLAFIVVTKRVNARFFLCGRGVENPGPGTVIDRDVVRRDAFDFYVIPQSVTQGSAGPTNFLVVYDSTQLSADNQQKLAYKLCHLYFNWTGTVRVPAPCQYAHKMAFLIGKSIHTTPHRRLMNRLYFL